MERSSRKPARVAAPPLLPLYAVERFPEKFVFRRPQGGQNQVREGTPRFRRALGGVLGRRYD